MHVVIPVAGEGTRLRPHTFSIPKVLLPVAGKPMLAHILDDVARLSPRKVTLVIGHLGDRIRSYVEENYSLPLAWVYQEKRQGLGHAVGMALDEKETGDLLVILGDTIIEADLSGFLSCGTSCIAVKEVEDPRRFGVVELEGEYAARLVEKPEKPTSNLAIVGLYYMKREGALARAIGRLVSEGIRTRGEYQLTDALQLMIADGERITAHRVEGWFDCGKPETLLSTNSHFLAKLPGGVPRNGCIIVDPVYIAPDAQVLHSVVGPDVSVSPGVRIERSVVSNSILCDGAQVMNIVLEESIIGPGARIMGASSGLNIGEEAQLKIGQVMGGRRQQ
jgi:glucose-1-phosphate thymidylyltransferase